MPRTHKWERYESSMFRQDGRKGLMVAMLDLHEVLAVYMEAVNRGILPATAIDLRDRDKDGQPTSDFPPVLNARGYATLGRNALEPLMDAVSIVHRLVKSLGDAETLAEAVEIDDRDGDTDGDGGATYRAIADAIRCILRDENIATREELSWARHVVRAEAHRKVREHMARVKQQQQQQQQQTKAAEKKGAD